MIGKLQCCKGKCKCNDREQPQQAEYDPCKYLEKKIPHNNCKCGHNCKCKDNSNKVKCACGDNCKCKDNSNKVKCACGDNCKCKDNSNKVKCACGDNCKCHELAYKKISIKVQLDAANEVPPTMSRGIGELTGTLYQSLDQSTNNNKFDYSWKVQNLTSDLVSAHFYNGIAGTNGDIVHPININSHKGTWTGISAENIRKLVNGGLHVNFHTIKYPNGEIRGQTFDKHHDFY